MMSGAAARPARRARSVMVLAGSLLSLAVVFCLAVDAFVHLRDAGDYAAVRTSVLSQADLFRIHAGLALTVAVVLLLRPSPWTWATAGLVLAAAAIAVVAYTYVDVGKLGPVPNMYEPTWALPGKAVSAWAEVVGAGLAVVGFDLAVRRRRSVT